MNLISGNTIAAVADTPSSINYTIELGQATGGAPPHPVMVLGVVATTKEILYTARSLVVLNKIEFENITGAQVTGVVLFLNGVQIRDAFDIPALGTVSYVNGVWSDEVVPPPGSGLTDAELRASPVDVDTGLLQALTDTELRATPVPVSGTVTANAGTNLNTSLLATSAKQDTLLTELQLKADLTETQPVSVATLPLPTDASTETTLSALNTKVPSGLTVTAGKLQVELPPGGTGLTDTELRASDVKITLDSEVVPVTGTFFQATQPISAVSLPLPTDASTETTLSALNTKVPSGLTVTAGKLQVELPPGGTGLTDTELRATPVPVSGTVTANAGTNLNTSLLALEGGGNLAAIKAKTDNIPPQGQALAAASVPVVLTAAQVSTLTPPAAITNFANETGGNLATLVAKDFATQTTLATRLSESDFDTKTGALTETAPATDTASSGLNGRLQRVAQRITSLITALGSPFQAGGSIGNTSFGATQATGTNLHTVVDSGTITANAGTNLNTSALALDATLTGGTQKTKLVDSGGTNVASVDASGALAIQSGGAVGSAKPSRAIYIAGNDGTNLVGIKVSATGVVSVDGSAVTQPVSLATNTPTLQSGSTTAVTQATATNLKTQAESYQGGVAVSATSPLAVKQTDTNTYVGRACTFRTPGRAGTGGQKIFSIHNATGSSVTVNVRNIFVDLYQTVVKAVTVPPPIIRAWKVTVLPTNGTAVTKVQIGGSGATSSSVTVLQDASSDGNGSGTTLTATLPAGTIVSQEFAPRLITAAGYEMADRIGFFGDSTIKLGALEGLVLYLDYTATTQNPTTDMWIVTCEWDEN